MKIAKLSLVAAVAVAGLSTANAQPLEQAIKDVDVSGSVVYRYDDAENDYSDSTTSNKYKIGLNLSSKVNEDVKLNTRFLVANGNGDFAGPLDTQAAGDSNVDVTLSNVYFGYTGIANTTVNVGKQGLTTPWTVAIDSDGAEQTGTGILALSTVGPVTFAAAYFNQTNLGRSGDVLPGLNGNTAIYTDSKKYGGNTVDVYDVVKDDDFGKKDIATIGTIAKLGPVTADAWYLDMQELFDSYTVGAKADFDLSGIKLGVDARYASLTFDNDVANALDREEDNSMAKIALTAKAGIVNGKIAYAMTDKDGGLTALDNDANTTLLGWNLNANDKFDADYWQAVIGVDILENLNLSANYGNLEHKVSGNKVEDEEIYAQLSYKMSKNLSSYVRFGEVKSDTENNETKDETRGRLQVEYTF